MPADLRSYWLLNETASQKATTENQIVDEDGYQQ